VAYVLGIDLGGTKALAGIIDVETGRVLSTAKKRSRAEHGPDDLIQRLVTVADDGSGIRAISSFSQSMLRPAATTPMTVSVAS